MTRRPTGESIVWTALSSRTLMRRRDQDPLARLVLLLDAAATALSMQLAVWQHGLLSRAFDVISPPVPSATVLSVTVAAVLIWVVGSAALGLTRSFSLEMTREAVLRGLLKLQFGGLLGLVLYLFLLQAPFNRSLLALFVGNSFVLLTGVRAVVRRYGRLQHQLGTAQRRLLVVGSAAGAAEWKRRSEAAPLSPVLVGRVGPLEEGEQAVTRLGPIEELRSILADHVVDLVVFVEPYGDSGNAGAPLDTCEELGIPAAFPIPVPEAAVSAPELTELLDCPVVLFDVAPRRAEALSVKHAIDVVAAVFGLIALAPLLLAVALAILLTSGRPVFFTQERAGLFGRPFKMLKFRTMVVGAESQRDALAAEHNEAGGPVFKMTEDPRVTRLGAWLRRTSIDELPQLVNVLLGQMSLVGPRPLPLVEQQAIGGWHRRRLSMKPGITCLWQVSGRSDVTFEQWMRMDVRYVDEWSLWLDLELLLRTVPTVLWGKGAR